MLGNLWRYLLPQRIPARESGLANESVDRRGTRLLWLLPLRVAAVYCGVMP